MYRRTGFQVLLVILLISIPRPSSSNTDNLALLAGTLKTMQRAACDDEIVSLACPQGTSISIQMAQYGKTAPQGHICESDRSRSHPVTVEIVGEQTCLWPNSMQYSLLQTVVEACQKKPHCKFSTSPKSVVDPCPAARKYVEVAYKCRPYEFRSRMECQDNVLKLSCNPSSRIAIYDAMYGRPTSEWHICPQTKGVQDEKCAAQHAAETVMQLCHGKRKCEVSASSKTFGNPCKPHSRTFLKIIYTCVPLGVLTERYETAAEIDEVRAGNIDHGLFDNSDGALVSWDESSTVAPAPAVFGNPVIPQVPYVYKEKTIETPKNTSTDSNSKLFVYVGIGVSIFVVLTVLLIGVRCYIIRRDARNTKSPDMFSTEVPNVFNDAISDVDNDIDVSHISGTFYDPVHPDMILFRENPAVKGTLRAMRPLSTIYPCAGSSMYGHVDYVPRQYSLDSKEPTTSIYKRDREEEEFVQDVIVSPKSLSRFPNSQYYYN